MTEKSDLQLESFLHCLDPELREADVGIEPSNLSIGPIVSTSQSSSTIRITNKGPRGLFSVRVSLEKGIKGVSLSTQTQDNLIILRNGQTAELTIEIDATLLPPEQGYSDALMLTKEVYTFRIDGLGTIKIPIAFYVDLPGYSKKKAKSPLIV